MFEDLLEARPPWIVGVINVTPDSFSDGGSFLDPSAAIARAYELRRAGAHLIELGAQSSAPGAQPISAEKELQRLMPVLKELAAQMPLCVDTYRASVARECLRMGAKVINDISGLRFDPDMAYSIGEFQAGVIVMHSKEADASPHASASERQYGDVVSDVTSFLKERVDYVLQAGIDRQNIILDPGMGRFLSGDPNVSWELLGRFNELCRLLDPFPLMVATSRKGFLGGSLEKRDFISQLSAFVAVAKGARCVRTHDVALAGQFLKLWNECPDGSSG